MNPQSSTIPRTSVVFCSLRALLTGAMCAVLAGLTAWAPAVVTQTLADGSAQDFQKGTPRGTAVTSTGKLTLGLAADKLTAVDADVIWCTATGPDGRLYLGTGHEGRIIAVSPGGKAEVYCYLDEFEAVALVFGPDGALYVGTAPGGKIYKITGRDQKALYFNTGEEAVWDLAVTPDGTLFAATGSTGKIFKITAREQGEEYFKADAKNVTDLIWSADGRLYALTHDKTFVLRVEGKARAFVLHQADQEEGRALAMDRAGNLYAALNAGARGGTDDVFKLPSRGEAGSASTLIIGAAPGGSDDAETAALSAAVQAASERSGEPPKGPPSRSGTEVVRITPEGYVDSLWKSPESPIHAMMFDAEAGVLLVAAGREGRLYSVDENGGHALVLATEQKYITALTRLDNRYLLATAKDVAVFAAPASAPKNGEFLSRVLDAQSTVHWGLMRVEAFTPGNSSLELALRSGNSKEPDDTWSEWSRWTTVDGEQARVEVPVARYAQYKARLNAGRNGESPELDTVRIYCAQPNRPPELRDLVISRGGPAVSRAGRQQSMSIPFVLPGGAGIEQGEGPQTPTPRPQQPTAANSNQKRLQVRWTARDPNGDALRFDLHLKGEDDPLWILIEENLDKPLYMLDTAGVADGPYRLRVVASDQPSNNPGEALTSEITSDRFIIDNTGPEFRELKWNAARSGSAWRVSVSVKASDSLSLLEEVAYRLDNQDDWQKLIPADQIFDSRSEDFSFTLSDVEAGAHLLAVQATDAEGNSTIERTVITVK
ncbi:MAG: hypothetical protein Kow0059_11710 [Candidatus Sumerlaeia bacterium]